MTSEFCNNDSLIDVLIKKGAVKDELLLKQMLVQLCNGLDAIHSKAKHAHLDLKPDNVLIGNDYMLKIIDFGFATPVETEISSCYGTHGYEAPEILDRSLRTNNTYKGV